MQALEEVQTSAKTAGLQDLLYVLPVGMTTEFQEVEVQAVRLPIVETEARGLRGRRPGLQEGHTGRGDTRGRRGTVGGVRGSRARTVLAGTELETNLG